MKYDSITKTDLKKKSEEYEIPFSNLLAAYVMEEIMCFIAESEFSNDLWLKANDEFDRMHYGTAQYFRLDFVYHLEEKVLRTDKMVSGQKLSKELIDFMLSSIFVEERINGIRWKYQYQWTEEEVIINVTAEFEEMKVPVEIHIDVDKTRGIFAEKKEFEPLFRGKRKVSYRHYPLESVLVEQLMQLVQYMELIPSMESYYIIYQIITKETVSGRHVQESIEEFCREGKIECSESRAEMLSDYQKYPYMRKRWEKFSRGLKKEYSMQKEEIPEWEEVSKVVFRFFLPIWNAIGRNEIFFGDWMPELGRYLD